MNDVLYFAYGSNLLRERLLPRGPNLDFVGRAALTDHRRTFDKVSDDTSGKCALEAALGEMAHGVLWSIPHTDLAQLDRHEGVGKGYEQCVMPITRENGEVEQAVTYRATRRQHGKQPFDWYLALVIAGATQQELPSEYVDRLRGIPFRRDEDASRKSRCDALDALDRASMMSVFLAL